jgi:hypothetical protein
MAQITQYEAPPSATEFRPKMEGINALQATSEQLRRVAINSSSIAHETGREIDRGLTELGAGASAMEAEAKKAHKQSETLAAVTAHADLAVKQTLDDQKAEKEADPLDSTVAETRRLQKKAERDKQLEAIPSTNPELRLEIGRRNAEADKADVLESIRVGTKRSVNALGLTLDKTLAAQLDQIHADPHSAFRIIENTPADMAAIAKNFHGLDADTSQKLVTEHSSARQAVLAKAAIEAYTEQDPTTAREQMKEGGVLNPLVKLLTPAEQEATYKLPEKVEREHHAQEKMKTSDDRQAAQDKDNAFLDKQTLSLYEGSNDQMPRNVARSHQQTLEAMKSGDISVSAGNAFLGALDKMQNQVEAGKDESTFNDMIRRHGPDYKGDDPVVNESQVWDLVSKGQLSFKRGKDFVDTFLKPGKSDPAFAEQAKSWRGWGQEQLNHGNKADVLGSARANEFARWYDDQVKRFGGDTSKFEFDGPFYKLMVQKIQQLQHPAHQPAAVPGPAAPEAGKRKPISDLMWGASQ